MGNSVSVQRSPAPLGPWCLKASLNATVPGLIASLTALAQDSFNGDILYISDSCPKGVDACTFEEVRIAIDQIRNPIENWYYLSGQGKEAVSEEEQCQSKIYQSVRVGLLVEQPRTPWCELRIFQRLWLTLQKRMMSAESVLQEDESYLFATVGSSSLSTFGQAKSLIEAHEINLLGSIMFLEDSFLDIPLSSDETCHLYLLRQLQSMTAPDYSQPCGFDYIDEKVSERMASLSYLKRFRDAGVAEHPRDGFCDIVVRLGEDVSTRFASLRATEAEVLSVRAGIRLAIQTESEFSLRPITCLTNPGDSCARFVAVVTQQTLIRSLAESVKK